MLYRGPKSRDETPSPSRIGLHVAKRWMVLPASLLRLKPWLNTFYRWLNNDCEYKKSICKSHIFCGFHP